VRSDMEFWKEVRRHVLTNELSQRAACAKYHLGWHTLKKILAHAEPLGYRTSRPRKKGKLEPFLPIIHEMLEADLQAPRKQRHTAQRIFERLRTEHGYEGGQTVVKDAVRAWRQSHQEVFLPLSHPPGEAQVDFGEATVEVPAGTQPGSLLRLRGKGLPLFGQDRKGDLYLALGVHISNRLSAGERELYDQLRSQTNTRSRRAESYARKGRGAKH